MDGILWICIYILIIIIIHWSLVVYFVALGGLVVWVGLAVESWDEARANRIRNEWSTWVLVRGLHASY